MGIIRNKKSGVPCAVVPQTAREKNHPFAAISGYSPIAENEYMLYRTLREAIPIIDAAIYKIVRLTVGFSLECDDKRQERELNRFAERVRVGAAGNGLQSFIAAYFEQLLTYGTALGEMVLFSDNSDIAALYNADLRSIELSAENPLKLKVCRRVGLQLVPVRRPELIMVSLLNPVPGSIKGVSLLKGLPFVSGILLKIYNSIGTNWERVGNLRYAVTYKPDGESLSVSNAKERAVTIAKEWSGAMSSREVRDFVAVGDVDIKVIGADNQILDSEIPVRQMLEQIVAKTGLPPFLLGLSWSSTERMSAQQSDILTSELEHYRRILTPVIMRICIMWSRLHGYGGEISVKWDDINLQDEVELARARLYNAQAEAMEKSGSGVS